MTREWIFICCGIAGMALFALFSAYLLLKHGSWYQNIFEPDDVGANLSKSEASEVSETIETPLVSGETKVRTCSEQNGGDCLTEDVAEVKDMDALTTESQGEAENQALSGSKTEVLPLNDVKAAAECQECRKESLQEVLGRNLWNQWKNDVGFFALSKAELRKTAEKYSQNEAQFLLLCYKELNQKVFDLALSGNWHGKLNQLGEFVALRIEVLAERAFPSAPKTQNRKSEKSKRKKIKN